ncbi:MAG TPA: hypothetical protein VGR32_05135 [Brevundimonas sp.]|jgi:hypothetical protein|uniref:hypothetical protein n=1 Tax=Brevundimonas sp. TaxID=1871086 RepID=UPI002DE5E218|nr:hypothetical protein [Brevundimonas sp.]
MTLQTIVRLLATAAFAAVASTAAAQSERTVEGAQAFTQATAEDGWLNLFIGRDPDGTGGYLTAHSRAVSGTVSTSRCTTTLELGRVHEARNDGAWPEQTMVIDWSRVTSVEHVQNFGRHTDSVEIKPAPDGWLYFTLVVRRPDGAGGAEHAGRLATALEFLRANCDRFRSTGF